MFEYDLKYLKTLSNQYPTVAEAAAEIINLQAVLSLPKGTEHFLTDIHGEYEQFRHILKNGSGSVRRKVDEVFGSTLSQKDKKALATLIYYPKERIEIAKKEEEYMDEWYKLNLYRLIQVAKWSSSKYTTSKVRKALPKEYRYIIEELLQEKTDVHDKDAYYNEIITTIISVDRAKEFIVTLSELIQQLVVDHLHIVGDIFDRGPGAHIVMDTIMDCHSVDIQWGNHDVVWMGAASGHLACIANVIRLSAKYGNLGVLEDGYGINLIPLVTFALNTYKDDPCECFKLTYNPDNYNVKDLEVDMKMHKAISVIQFKLEGQLIMSRPGFHMEKRLLLDKMNLEKGIVVVDGKEYALKDTNFPTIDMNDPYKLTKEEEAIMERLRQVFLNCEKLQKHVKFLFDHGSLYLVYNNNLLYHGCVPFNEDGTFRKVCIAACEYSGKSLYDILEVWARKGYYFKDSPEHHIERDFGQDIMWYIWSNENSPVYGKEKMATFERYFLDDKEIQSEKKDYYYTLIEKEECINMILEEFGLDRDVSHIINGHVPVKQKKGESPIKCKGKLLIIDGGFSKAYQPQTGIAGYTLIYNSYGLRLVSHEPFESTEHAIKNESDIYSEEVLVEKANHRIMVADTDVGKQIQENIRELRALLKAYREGTIRERDVK